MRRADPRKPRGLARRAAGKVASPFSKDVPFRSVLRDHMSKRIGIVTCGGDCPGLNAVIRAVSKAAAKRDSRETFHLLAALSFHHRHMLESDESLIRLQEGFCYDYSSLF